LGGGSKVVRKRGKSSKHLPTPGNDLDEEFGVLKWGKDVVESFG